MNTEVLEVTSYSEVYSNDVGIDGYTGATAPVPTPSHPSPHVEIVNGVQTDGLDVFNAGSQVQFAIWFAAPNAQVWARETSINEHQKACPIALAVQFPPLSPTGACLIGSTDANGYFVFTYTVPPFYAARAMQFWVGAQTPNPNDPSGKVTDPVDDTKKVGGVVFWVKNAQTGLPAPPY